MDIPNILTLPAIACIPAAILLVVLPFVLEEKMADGVWVPLVAYLGSVVIWAVLVKRKCVDVGFKTVGETLVDGRWYQIGGCSLILTFIAPYLVVFSQKGRWNEVATAIAVVIIILKHMIKTSMAIHQVEEFRNFTRQCVDTVKFMGYGNFEGVQDHHMREEISLNILVNKDLVEDRFSRDGSFRLEPVDAYVRWGTMFLASCGAEWLQDFGISLDNDGVPSESWNAKQHAFARNLWESCLKHVVCEHDKKCLNGKQAGLHHSKRSNRVQEDVITIDDTAPPQGMLSMFPAWLIERYYEHGCFSKDAVLREAFSEGKVIPYQTSITTTAIKDDGIWIGAEWRDIEQDSTPTVSLKAYATRIKYILDRLPVHFHLERHKEWMRKISYKSLEWFLVYMHLFHKVREYETPEKVGHEYTSEDEGSEISEQMSETEPLFGRA